MSAQASANSTASNKALNENLILKSYEKKSERRHSFNKRQFA